MSDQGLSIFEDAESTSGGKHADTGDTASPTAKTQYIPRVTAPAAASGRPNFPESRRGYDRAAVDSHIAGLNSDLTALRARATELEAAVGHLRTQLDEHERPSYAGLGGRASELLRLAEEQADAMIAEAHGEASRIRERATREAQAITAKAGSDAEDMRVIQLAELDEQRARTVADLEGERNRLLADAEDTLAAAQREAAQLRLAAEQEANAQRTAVAREVEKVQAGADREAAEARRVLTLEKERLAREAQEFHATAMAETEKLVKDAEARANGAEDRAREAIAASRAQREQATTEGEQVLVRARREAEQLLMAAKKQAEAIGHSGREEAERGLDAIRHEVERLTKRRDAITAQLGALRDVVAGFGDD